MATRKKSKTPAKTRRRATTSSVKRKYSSTSRRRAKGLSGFSLGAIKNVKQQDVLEMVKNSGAIILGYVAGKVGGSLIAKAIVKPGDEQGFAKYIEPILQLGGGVILTASAGKNQFFKYAGAGMVTSGVVTGIEKATKKSIMDLLGVNRLEGFLGLDGDNLKTIDDIDEIVFNPSLPDLGTIDDEIDFEGFDSIENMSGTYGDERGSEVPANYPEAGENFSGAEDEIEIL